MPTRTSMGWSLACLMGLAAGVAAQAARGEERSPVLVPEPRTVAPERLAAAAPLADAQPGVVSPSPPLPSPVTPAPAMETGAVAGSAPASPCPSGQCGCEHSPRGIWKERIKPYLQESSWGYAEEFQEVPFGERMRAHMNRQICNGLAEQVVLYRYDFVDGPIKMAFQLNAHGRQRLGEIMSIMQCHGFYPLVIEASGNAELDQARRGYVLRLMAESSFAVVEDSVVVGQPRAKGLSGVEAVLMQQNLLRQTKSRGASSGGGTVLTPGGQVQ